MLKDKAGRISTFEDTNAPVDFSEDFRTGIIGVLNDKELGIINALTPLKDIGTESKPAAKKPASTKRDEPQRKVEYSRWKTPIQNCMVREQLQGCSPKDVSKKELGYDIESTDKRGNTRYFSVKPVDALGNAFVLSEKEYACAERLGANYGVYIIENGNPENNMLVENIAGITFEKRVREWEWVSGQYEVIKTPAHAELTSIDSKLIEIFSLRYLNRVQVSFLKTVCSTEDLSEFEKEFSCKATSIANQINSIADFYLGDSLLENTMRIKDKYLVSIKYLLSRESL